MRNAVIVLLLALLATSAQAQQFGGKSGVGGKSGIGGGSIAATSHTFTHAQTTAYNDSGGVTGVTSITATLGAVPDVTKAHIISVAIGTYQSGGIMSVVDENSNQYTASPTGPNKNDGATGTETFYFLRAPVSGTAGKSITVTLISNGSGIFNLYVDDFSSGTSEASFDMDASATVLNAAAGSTTLPSLTPTSSGELLISAGTTSDTFSGVGGSWTQNDHGSGFGGNNAAYILSSASGATAVAFTDPSTFNYGTVGMAFK